MNCCREIETYCMMVLILYLADTKLQETQACTPADLVSLDPFAGMMSVIGILQQLPDVLY